MRADLFVLSLLAGVTLGGVPGQPAAAGWATLFFCAVHRRHTVLFGCVPWSKFAHMFFKPAAALPEPVAEADGSMENLPPPADGPATFGLGIKREAPRHY